MSDFDFSTLITDRSQADVSALSALMAKKLDEWTDEEREKFNNGMLKGGYWWTDLNRVTACMEYINRELKELGYETGYKPVVVHQGSVPADPILPDGYKRVEYLKGLGSAGIEVGLKLNSESYVKVSFICDQLTGAAIFGSEDAWKVNAFAVYSHLAEFGTSTVSLPTTADKREITINKGSVYQDGDLIGNIYTSGFFGGYNVCVFGRNRGGNLGEFSVSTIFSFEYSIDGVDFFELVPCVDSYGNAWVYDTGSKNFYPADKTNFLAGPEVEQETGDNVDPYTWYESDSPTVRQMAQYLANVAAIRSVFTLPEYVPKTPESMALLTFAKANDIESVLQYVETTIQQTVKGMARSNSFTFWSGNRAFPTAESNRGRNWGELDSMETGWRNWQMATWYLLLYGNFKAEGDVI